MSQPLALIVGNITRHDMALRGRRTTRPALPRLQPERITPANLLEEMMMGLLDSLMGNASKVDASKMQAEFQQVLAAGEQIEHAYQLFRDSLLFTNRRLILVDKQGMTGRKIEYHSIPYRSVTHFKVETAGHFDLEAELKIWISSTAEPISKTFNRGLSIYEVQAVLAAYVAKG